MRKILITLLSIAIASTTLFAQNSEHKAFSEQKLQKMDRKLTKHQAHKRTFHSKKEFIHKKKMQRSTLRKQIIHNNMRYPSNKSYDNGYFYSQEQKRVATPRQRGYRYSKRGWMLAYRYDRASFYDNEGYHYGYFNRHGYYFEGVFYRYDRDYTYQDRVRGRGLFDYRYYMPENARYYGFSQRVQRSNHYDRGFNRY
jgi:hypothetical protein